MYDPVTSEILANMHDGVLVLNFEGSVIYMNHAAKELLHLQETDVVNRTYTDLFMSYEENDAFNDILFNGLQKMETRVSREATFLRPDKQLIYLEVTTSFLRSESRSGDESGVIIVFRDISESKALDRARQRVVDHLSHELKTPLAIIDATLKRIKDPENAGLVERLKHNVKRLQEIQHEAEDIFRQGYVKESGPAGRWLEQTVELLNVFAEKNEKYADVVKLMKKEMGELFMAHCADPQRLDIAAYVYAAKDYVQEFIPHRRILMLAEIDCNPEIWMDPNDCNKVLTALMKNAVEATPDGGTVTVALKQTNGHTVLEVRDTGVGITEESQRQIFGGFYHARGTDVYSTKRPFDFGAGGKGLDLLQLKIISNTYQFQIECESRRCRFIPGESDLCPGSIAACSHIKSAEECARAGGTTFRLIFRPI